MRQETLLMATASLGAAMTTMALADTENFDLTGFDGVAACEGLNVSVTIAAESDSARQLDRL